MGELYSVVLQLRGQRVPRHMRQEGSSYSTAGSPTGRAPAWVETVQRTHMLQARARRSHVDVFRLLAFP